MKHRTTRQVFPYACILVLTLGLVLAAWGGWSLWRGYERRAASYDLREVAAIPQRSVVYDSTGQPIAWLQGENRFLIPLHRVPLSFLLALIAREDSRFQEHSGVDYSGIARAMVTNLSEGRIRQGGSTITQQLARNTYRLSARTLDRKLLEALLARRIEQKYSKRQILEFYLNRIYFGEGCYGLQQAARYYFGKPAQALTLGESATLVGLIRSPNSLSPLKDLASAMEQRNLVLERMAELQMITPGQEQSARGALERLGRNDQPHGEGYVLDAVRRELQILLTPRQQEMGGLKITITIDPKLQLAAEKALEQRISELEKTRWWKHPSRAAHRAPAPGEPERTDYLQAALVAVENGSGAIRALVGGRSYAESKYDRACLAKRQVGSSFKPFVYASAFEQGLLPGDSISDGPLLPGEFGPGFPKKWAPKNSDGQYSGYLPASNGLIRSRNTMSIRVGERAGLPNLLGKAGALGLQLPPFPAVYIGGFEATLRDLTSAFTVFPNSGEWRPAYLIARIEDAAGREIYHAPHPLKQVFRADAAETASDLMEAVIQSGTAKKAASMGLKKIAAGKTGTSNDCKDAWFLGYTRSVTCGVWVGFDRPQEIMKGGYGSVLALPIWVDVIQKLSEKQYPSGVLCEQTPKESVAVCRESGQLANAGCEQAGLLQITPMRKGMAPAQTCPLHRYEAPWAQPQNEIIAEEAEQPRPSRRVNRRSRLWETPPRTMRSRIRRSSPVAEEGDTLYRTRSGPVIIRRYPRGEDPYW